MEIQTQKTQIVCEGWEIVLVNPSTLMPMVLTRNVAEIELQPNLYWVRLEKGAQRVSYDLHVSFGRMLVLPRLGGSQREYFEDPDGGVCARFVDGKPA